VTIQKPDLVAYNDNNKELFIFELSVPFESNIENTHQIKVVRYKQLIADIEANGIQVKYYPVEVGSRGHITKDNEKRLKDFVKHCTGKFMHKKTLHHISKMALISSFIIYHSKYEALWNSPPYVNID
jgi:hypothetical protein